MIEITYDDIEKDTQNYPEKWKEYSISGPSIYGKRHILQEIHNPIFQNRSNYRAIKIQERGILSVARISRDAKPLFPHIPYTSDIALELEAILSFEKGYGSELLKDILNETREIGYGLYGFVLFQEPKLFMYYKNNGAIIYGNIFYYPRKGENL